MRTKQCLWLPILALVAAVLQLQGCTREESPPPPTPERPREAFHASKPLRLIVSTPREKDTPNNIAWLERELRYLLGRGKMRIAPILPSQGAQIPSSEAELDSVGTFPSSAALERETQSASRPFILKIEIDSEGQQAQLQLIAPDNIVERRHSIELPDATRLAVLRTLAEVLPKFVDAPSSNWSDFIGTQDGDAYESYMRSADALFGASSQGFTRPPASRTRTRAVERLEALSGGHPQFARVWAALAVGYLGLGGEDETSLLDLAESSAERAIALDEEIAEAHAALGLVHLRRNDWIAAHGKFRTSLSLDANMVVALEGLACLLVDAGHYRAAAPHAMRAVALQPRNAGASECLTYVQIAHEETPQIETSPIAAVARVRSLSAFLNNDRTSARKLLRNATSSAEFNLWAEPVLRAASNRKLVADALKAITRAANERYIDPWTEILCGTALRQPNFVFNRIARQQREDAPAPLRLLWLPKTDFLRQHPRFEEAISNSGLPAFWHGSGPPDVCAHEPKVYGCNVSAEGFSRL